MSHKKDKAFISYSNSVRKCFAEYQWAGWWRSTTSELCWMSICLWHVVANLKSSETLLLVGRWSIDQFNSYGLTPQNRIERLVGSLNLLSVISDCVISGLQANPDMGTYHGLLLPDLLLRTLKSREDFSEDSHSSWGGHLPTSHYSSKSLLCSFFNFGHMNTDILKSLKAVIKLLFFMMVYCYVVTQLFGEDRSCLLNRVFLLLLSFIVFFFFHFVVCPIIHLHNVFLTFPHTGSLD